MPFILILLLSYSGLSYADNHLINNGDSAYAQGNYIVAAKNWRQALENDPLLENAKQVDLLQRLAAAYQDLAMHVESMSALAKALALVDKATDDPQQQAQQARVLSQLSDTWLIFGEIAKAIKIAKQAVSVAELSQNQRLIAGAYNNLANAQAVHGEFEAAQAAFSRSIEAAAQAHDQSMWLKASLNQVDVIFSDQNPDKLPSLLAKIAPALAAAPATAETATLHLAFANLAERGMRYFRLIAQHKNSQNLLNQAQQHYQSVLKMNGSSQRQRALAYGELGKLYENINDLNSAEQLTQRALFFSHQGNFEDILYRWQWQQGRIFKAQGKTDAAINSYRAAIKTLKPIQQRMEIGYRSPPASFDQRIRPVYYQLTELLIQKAEHSPDHTQQQEWLKSAMDVIEAVKMVELKNYFRDECVLQYQNRQQDLALIADNTAILYPMPLEKRLIVLVNIDGEIYPFSTEVESAEFNDTVINFRILLQTRPHNGFLKAGWKIYDWLFKPLESLLAAEKIDTIVIVPDGKLRMIPFSTIHDRKGFLIERFAFATTPGLSLVDPQPMDWKNNQILLAGLSDAVQDYPPLPNVSNELAAIQKITGKGDTILNSEYSIAAFTDKMQQKSYSVIHLATHGEFSADPDHTYLLTHDEKMKMDKLSSIIGLGKFREHPVELLTLSACRTAVGDDKSALGLAGVAIKAGAKSAVATLWFVDDEATSITMKNFYKQMVADNGLSKAKSLQKAQNMLLSNPRYWHPSYWGPFLLIGNWL